MSNLKKDLIVAFQEGNFLKVIYDKSLSELENRDNLSEELVSMHNDGLLNVIAGFRGLKNESGTGSDFFITRHIFENILPRLNAPVQPVMDCVLHLVNEAGQDMAAGILFTPFIDFCAAEPSRPKESLKHIEANDDQLADLLTPTIVAGTRIDIEYYFKEAIRLTEHENIEIRKRAIFSFSNIQYTQEFKLYDLALVCLEQSLSKENDDHLLSNLITATFSLYKHNKSQLARITDLIKGALSKGDEYSLHSASKLFGFDYDELPETLLDVLLGHLQFVKPKNKMTIDCIDYGLVKLLDKEDSTNGIAFIETLLLNNPNDLSLNSFNSVTRKLLENKNNILNRLLTRWFLRGDRPLCEGIYAVVNRVHNHNMILSIETSELNSSDSINILFLARKAVGYLFSKPVTATSIIISLLEHTTEGETIQQLTNLLFDPLLINYPGSVKDYLNQQMDIETAKKKPAIEAALKAFDDYLNDLKSTGDIPELHPSQSHRDAYRRHFSRLMSESMKKAEKESIFSSICSKSVLLYGIKSINYVYGPNGQSKRMEIPLQSYGTDMEFPRYEIIDPFGLDYMLRVFRVEQRAA